jgi:hypothetical protein
MAEVIFQIGSEFAVKHLDSEIGREKYLSWVGNLIQSK